MNKPAITILTVIIISVSVALLMWEINATTKIKLPLNSRQVNNFEKGSERPYTPMTASEIFSDDFYPDDWNWDLGQDCYGLTSVAQCADISWPMNCKNCGCRTADIISCQQCIANKNSDPELCESIISEDNIVEDFWQDNCYWGLVIKFRDEGRTDKIYFCDRFVEPEHKKACYDIAKK